MSLEQIKTTNVLGIFFLLLFIITRNYIFLYVSFIIFLAGTFISPFGSRLSKLWLGFSLISGKLNTKVILFLTYFLVLTPLAFLRKITSKHTISLKKPATETYWKQINKKFSKEDLEKLW